MKTFQQMKFQSFSEYGLKAYAALQETGKYMLRAIALYLNLDEMYFDDYIQYGNSILRPIHYGPIKRCPKKMQYVQDSMKI